MFKEDLDFCYGKLRLEAAVTQNANVNWPYQLFTQKFHSKCQLTSIFHAVAAVVQRSGIEFQANDGKNDDGEQDEQCDL